MGRVSCSKQGVNIKTAPERPCADMEHGLTSQMSYVCRFYSSSFQQAVHSGSLHCDSGGLHQIPSFRVRRFDIGLTWFNIGWTPYPIIFPWYYFHQSVYINMLWLSHDTLLWYSLPSLSLYIDMYIFHCIYICISHWWCGSLKNNCICSPFKSDLAPRWRQLLSCCSSSLGSWRDLRSGHEWTCFFHAKVLGFI